MKAVHYQSGISELQDVCMDCLGRLEWKDAESRDNNIVVCPDCDFRDDFHGSSRIRYTETPDGCLFVTNGVKETYKRCPDCLDEMVWVNEKCDMSNPHNPHDFFEMACLSCGRKDHFIEIEEFDYREVPVGVLWVNEGVPV